MIARLIVFCVLCCSAVPAAAVEQRPTRRQAAAVMMQPPAAARLEIKAPDAVLSRGGVVLNAETEGVKGLAWRVFPTSAESALVRIPGFPDGEVNPLVFIGGAPDGEYNFIVAGVTAAGKAILDTHTVKVGGDTPPGPQPQPVPPGPTPQPTPPQPTPTPTPPTPPAPAPEPSKLGIFQIVQTAAAGVSDSNKAANAQALAEICETLESQIAAGAIPDAAAAQQAFKSKVLALGILRMRPWLSVVSSLKTEFDRLVKSGQLKTMADYQQAFHEAAQALRLVKLGQELKFGRAY